jgi:hypothetical protein
MHVLFIKKKNSLVELQINTCLINNYWKDHEPAGKILVWDGIEMRNDGYNNRGAHCRKKKTREGLLQDKQSWGKH